MNYNSHSKLGRILGGVFTLLYSLVFGALMLWGGFSVSIEEVGQGILVDFGTTLESGSGEEDTPLADDYSLPEPTAVPEKSEPVQTQEVEESPAMEEANIATDTAAPVVEQKEVEPTPPAEEPKPREVNKRALFPGGKQESQSKSEGKTDKGEGNQGYIGGTQSETYEGTGGEGGFEPDWNLEGRRPRSEFPRPKAICNDFGTVVIEIWVDGNGDVTLARVIPKDPKSNTYTTLKSSSPHYNEALQAAWGAKFNESDQDTQSGTIIYKFSPKL